MENTMGKDEIANSGQFHLFPQCFPKAFFFNMLKWVYIEGKVKPFTTQSCDLTTLRKKSLKDIVGKGENAANQHFLLVPQSFLPYSAQISIFNSLPKNKFLDWSKLKAFADDKINVT